VLNVIALLLGKVTRSHIVTVLCLAVVSVLAGGVAFSIAEHVTMWTGLYWSVTTASTVGYGDVTPHTGSGRIIAVAVMLTAIPLLAAAFALVAAAATAARLSRFLNVEPQLPSGRFVVLLGMHPTIPLVSQQLHDAGYLVVVAADVETSDLPAYVQHVRGSPTSEATVTATNPGHAKSVLLVSQDDGELLVTAVLLRHLAPDVPVVAIAQSTRVAVALSDLGVGQTISTEALLGNTLAKSLESPHAADVLLSLMDGPGYRIEEIEVPPQLTGTSLRAARTKAAGLLLGIVRDGKVNLGIGDDPMLASGDRIVQLSADVPSAPVGDDLPGSQAALGVAGPDR
jgi:voltage-gated potassium channel